MLPVENGFQGLAPWESVYYFSKWKNESIIGAIEGILWSGFLTSSDGGRGRDQT